MGKRKSSKYGVVPTRIVKMFKNSNVGKVPRRIMKLS
jgi:hypothetical protein